MMWPVEILNNLQKTVLRNLRLSERIPEIRMAYKYLVALLNRSCRYRILNTHTATLGAGTSNPELKVQAPMTVDPIDVLLPHEHTGETEPDGEDPVPASDTTSGPGSVNPEQSIPYAGSRCNGGGSLTEARGDDYNLDEGGVELESDTDFALERRFTWA
ncbi:hypothetical protein PIB30_021207 [Stylosanthes scabra]|uniref:Uncharacterized protein n=1 Tax=Stylosanthes scabra TaxID=79078 RepID=A0ABU6U8P9_9FABA|nr:hypothetical protein [Stylosanthes scabra]